MPKPTTKLAMKIDWHKVLEDAEFELKQAEQRASDLRRSIAICKEKIKESENASNSCV